MPSVDPLDVALPTLLNDLATSGTRSTLILDDYHLLTDVRIHEAVEYLLSYLPPSLRLVIAARFDPPLPLARMRARGELTEIRAADLRFRVTEAAVLVAAVSQIDVGSGAVDALVERTEGWAAGLKLAALTIRGSDDPEHPLRRPATIGTPSTSSPRRCWIDSRPIGGRSSSGPRCWTGCRVRSATRWSAVPDRRRSWKPSSGPTSSSSRWMIIASGSDTTPSSGTC